MAKIIAVVTVKPEKVKGGLPAFLTADEGEMTQIAKLLEKILDAAAHRLGDDLFIIVDRH
jgi:hypothetical protein